MNILGTCELSRYVESIRCLLVRMYTFEHVNMFCCPDPCLMEQAEPLFARKKPIKNTFFCSLARHGNGWHVHANTLSGAHPGSGWILQPSPSTYQDPQLQVSCICLLLLHSTRTIFSIRAVHVSILHWRLLKASSSTLY